MIMYDYHGGGITYEKRCCAGNAIGAVITWPFTLLKIQI